MSNFLYKKETFIYEQNNSITNDLCKDIIEIYNNDKQKYEKYNIDVNNEYAKLKTFLMKELNTHIHKYEKQINKINNYKMINIKNTNFSFFIENKNKNNKDFFNYINRFSIEKQNNVKLFMYIWFLNDYDGEIFFWNEYRITPKCGKFIMFPISWCFPYQEIIHSDANKYILYGYIYK
jgi:hypothetical protein